MWKFICINNSHHDIAEILLNINQSTIISPEYFTYKISVQEVCRSLEMDLDGSI